MQRERLDAIMLCGLSLVNYALFYATSILLARSLSVHDFEHYNVGVSTVLLLVAFATIGLEKYALRILPTLHYQEKWSQTRGFLQFSQRFIFVLSLVLVVLLGVALEGTLIFRGKDYHIAVVIAALFVPVIALFQFCLEVVTAYGGHLKAVATYRLLLPVLLLGLNAIVWLSPLPSNAVSAVVCYGIAWIVAFGVLQSLIHHAVPTAVWATKATRRRRRWLREAWPLAATGVFLTMFAHTGIIVLKLNDLDHASVSAYAMAFQTGTFVVLIATSTNRLYSPLISKLLASGDFEELRAAGRRRRRLIGPLTLAYVLFIFFFGRSILAVFGDEFVVAYPALCIIAIGASVSTLFSLAPTFLQFTDRSRLVLLAMAVSVLLNIVLCFPLSSYYDSTGAAAAYAIPVSLLYFVLWLQAKRDMTRYLNELSEANQ